MLLADTLSHAPYSPTAQQAEEVDSFDVMTVSYISSSHLEGLKDTLRTNTMQTTMQILSLSDTDGLLNSARHLTLFYFHG